MPRTLAEWSRDSSEYCVGSVGMEGCVAKRWRTLCLGSLPDLVLPLFCVPAPNLVDLELQFLGLQNQRLPETPLLETFCTIHSEWLYPDLQNVTDLNIRGDYETKMDSEAISKAQKLIKLTVIDDGGSGQLRGDFPVLEYLHLWEENFLNGFSAPRLKTLSLEHRYRESYRHVLKCPGIRFHALEEIVFCLDSCMDWSSIESTHPEGVRLLLQAAVSIKVLRVTSRESMATMLEILDDLSICQNHHFTLKYLDYSMALCQGEAGRSSIAAIRLEEGL